MPSRVVTVGLTRSSCPELETGEEAGTSPFHFPEGVEVSQSPALQGPTAFPGGSGQEADVLGRAHVTQVSSNGH